MHLMSQKPWYRQTKGSGRSGHWNRVQDPSLLTCQGQQGLIPLSQMLWICCEMQENGYLAPCNENRDWRAFPPLLISEQLFYLLILPKFPHIFWLWGWGSVILFRLVGFCVLILTLPPQTANAALGICAALLITAHKGYQDNASKSLK